MKRQRFVRPVRLLVALALTTIASAAAAEPRVFFVPAAFPDAAAVDLNANPSDARFCTADLAALDRHRAAIGLPSCPGSGAAPDATQTTDIDVVLLVDDRRLSPALAELLGPAVVQTRIADGYWKDFADCEDGRRLRVIVIGFSGAGETPLEPGPEAEVDTPESQQPGTPRLTFSASPGAVEPNGTAMLSWQATNAQSCRASGGWSGSRPTASRLRTASLSRTTRFVLTCEGAGGQVVRRSRTVHVEAPSAPAEPGAPNPAVSAPTGGPEPAPASAPASAPPPTASSSGVKCSISDGYMNLGGIRRIAAPATSRLAVERVEKSAGNVVVVFSYPVNRQQAVACLYPGNILFPDISQGFTAVDSSGHASHSDTSDRWAFAPNLMMSSSHFFTQLDRRMQPLFSPFVRQAPTPSPTPSSTTPAPALAPQSARRSVTASPRIPCRRLDDAGVERVEDTGANVVVVFSRPLNMAEVYACLYPEVDNVVRVGSVGWQVVDSWLRTLDPNRKDRWPFPRAMMSTSSEFFTFADAHLRQLLLRLASQQ